MTVSRPGGRRAVGPDRPHAESYRGTSVLVTGGAGAIGGNLCRALATLGARVTVVDDLSSSDPTSLAGIPGCALVEGSILDPGILARAFAERPRIVFHLAALFANQKSVEQPEQDLLVNGLGTLRVLEAARGGGTDRIVYTSSSCVYGDDAPVPVEEETVSLDPGTPYQLTKLLGELYCRLFETLHAARVVRVRLFNSYGPGDMPGRYRSVIPNFVFRALTRQPLPITGTGEETRDFTYVGDLVNGLLRAGVMDEALGEAVNLGSGRETRILDLAAQVNQLTGNDAGIEHAARREWDTHQRRWASIDKAKRLLGYEPATDLGAGLRETVEWFRAHWPRILASARF
ncbi:MAG TPA: NAD-dependent epimerase/dehydratase family protein [Methylomirabilota bacterium]|jgi:nucleoside-diphosphate-sugar epimerase